MIAAFGLGGNCYRCSIIDDSEREIEALGTFCVSDDDVRAVMDSLSKEKSAKLLSSDYGISCSK
tara:strand:+ start:717 stop:908 length:192 start_codon:yes stop_codon:yes gene_type:complete